VSFRKPRPRPPKRQPAFEVLNREQCLEIAAQVQYVGSQHHTDIPKYGLENKPRPGFMPIAKAEKLRIANPSCTICPRKWASRRAEATALLQNAIENGHFVVEANATQLPQRVWARDPEDVNLVYEAKLLSSPSNGYKAYPLTRHQAQALPFELP
jgi:hypothetical protein